MRPAAPLVALLFALAGCTSSPDPEATPGPTAEASSPESGPTGLAVGTPVTLMGAGDIAGDTENAAATAALIAAAGPHAVFTTGDNAYPDGALSDYLAKYHPTWGAFKDRTRPVPGNHDYRSESAEGYLDYFGAASVTNPVDGGLYYAWDVGNGWRAYALNTEVSTSSAQLEWLRNDVAAHPGQHYIVYTHRPRYTSSDEHGPSDDICPLWTALADTGALEIALFGHNHHYERFAPMDCAGQASADGVRSFVVGSGGKELYGFGPAEPGSEFRNDSDFGVLKFVLHESSYEWEFIASGRGQDGDRTIDTGNAGQILDKGSAAV
jgi:hypothetical protein